MINRAFWAGKKVFLTGHTGFKGSWLSHLLYSLGAEVHGYSLDPPTNPSMFKETNVQGCLNSDTRGDILDFKNMYSCFTKVSPDIVIHLAAQPLVRLSYREPVNTFQTNVVGTANLLECLRLYEKPVSGVIITTDKVYQNNEWHWGYRENDSLGGYDPYSASKACTELVINSYRQSFFNIESLAIHGIGLASARAGNVFGGGDWSEDRLIPDLVRSFASNEIVKIRNPKAVRPWEHVLEPLSQYLVLIQNLTLDKALYSGAWNFGPEQRDAKNVGQICDIATKSWGGEAQWEFDGGEHPHEAGYLYLDISKSKSMLNYEPKWDLELGLEKTFKWYKSSLAKMNMEDITKNQIAEYLKLNILTS